MASALKVLSLFLVPCTFTVVWMMGGFLPSPAGESPGPSAYRLPSATSLEGQAMTSSDAVCALLLLPSTTPVKRMEGPVIVSCMSQNFAFVFACVRRSLAAFGNSPSLSFSISLFSVLLLNPSIQFLIPSMALLSNMLTLYSHFQGFLWKHNCHTYFIVYNNSNICSHYKSAFMFTSAFIFCNLDSFCVLWLLAMTSFLGTLPVGVIWVFVFLF